MKRVPPAKFSNRSDAEFFKTVRQRVNNYFKEQKISPKGNYTLWLKAIVMYALYFTPLILLLLHVVTHPAAVLGLWVLMGLGASGIGLAVMHDANHGTFSKYKWLNKLMGLSLNIIGGFAFNWRIQHNQLHHTYTNLEGADEDIDADPVLRLSPHQKTRKLHRFQHIYAWILYGISTVSWVADKDYFQLIRYKKMGLVNPETFKKQFVRLLAWKGLYYSYTLVIPMLFFPGPWWLSLIGLFLAHFVAGLFITSIFQLAHVMPSSTYPLPDKDGNMENGWAIHQLYTTTNFAPKSKLLGWFIGGLNYQIEHHLFPGVSHIHYKKIAGIVQQTAKEFNLPYYTKPTFFSALADHFRMLKVLGTGTTEIQPLKLKVRA